MAVLPGSCIVGVGSIMQSGSLMHSAAVFDSYAYESSVFIMLMDFFLSDFY